MVISLEAQAMRCAQGIIDEGDLKYDVEKKCGEPRTKDIYTQRVPLYDFWGNYIGVQVDTYERWVYQRSSADFRYEIIFQDGKIKEIKTGRD